jgi:hypothetical protein
VWSKELRFFDYVALTLKEKNFHEFLIDRPLIEPFEVSSTDDEEWGPDLCFLRIPPVKVGIIEAYKAFYNLSKRREFALNQSPIRLNDAGRCANTAVALGGVGPTPVLAGPRWRR